MVSLALSQFPFTAALLLFFAGIRLDAKLVIIDDADTSRITYSPEWSYGSNCSGCWAHPDGANTFGGTWHDVSARDAVENPFFMFNFTGTYVEARYIAMDATDIVSIFLTGMKVNVSYSIDGVERGTFFRNPANPSAPTTFNSYAYNQSLFNVTGLTNTEHTLRVDLWPTSVLLLDYLIYDDGSVVHDESPPSKPDLNLIGGVVGGVVVVAICCCIARVVMVKRKRASRKNVN